MEEQYAVLIGDIVESRKYDKEMRQLIQKTLILTMHFLNQIFEPALKVETDFTAGDEVQGLFNTAEDAYMYYRFLSMMMFPVRMRAGIGIGQWDLRMTDLGTQAQDGTAYHRARRAIQEVREFRTQCIRIVGSASDTDMNVLMNASRGLNKQMTSRQHTVYALMECLFPLMIGNRMNCQPLEILGALFIPDEINAPSFTVSPVQVIDLTREPEEIAFPKGMVQKIAEVMETSRQNVENIISAGNLLEIRTLDIHTILKLHKGEPA